MKNTCPLYIVFQFLKILLIKIQPPDLLFLVVYISFYISRRHFSQICKTSLLTLSKKKVFVMNFPFLTDFVDAP